MRDRVWMFIALFFHYSGLLRLVRWRTQQAKKRLIVLNYHQAANGDLRSHFLYLRRHYNIVPLETALEALYLSNHQMSSSIKDPRSQLALTFDDGYADNYTHAFALACELHIPITIFLISGYTGCDCSFWWADRLLLYAQKKIIVFAENTYRIGQLTERKALAQALNAHFSSLKTPLERDAFLSTLRELLGLPSSIAFTKRPVPLLDWEQIREMKESGWVTFGAHTVHHPVLSSLTNPLDLEHEIVDCRTILEHQLERPIRAFAYPYGGVKQIGPSAAMTVQKAGYTWAVTTLSGVNTPESDPYLLRRRSARSEQHWLLVAIKVAGVADFCSRVLHRPLTLMRKYIIP